MDTVISKKTCLKQISGGGYRFFLSKNHNIHSFETETQDAWIDILREKEYEKGDYMLRVGQIPRNVAFTDETFIVMKGILTIQMKDREIKAKEGSVVHVPRFTPHGFCNHSSEEIKIMLVFNPGQQREGFFYGMFEHRNKETMNNKSLAVLNERLDTVII